MKDGEMGGKTDPVIDDGFYRLFELISGTTLLCQTKAMTVITNYWICWWAICLKLHVIGWKSYWFDICSWAQQNHDENVIFTENYIYAYLKIKDVDFCLFDIMWLDKER